MMGCIAGIPWWRPLVDPESPLHSFNSLEEQLKGESVNLTPDQERNVLCIKNSSCVNLCVHNTELF